MLDAAAFSAWPELRGMDRRHQRLGNRIKLRDSLKLPPSGLCPRSLIGSGGVSQVVKIRGAIDREPFTGTLMAQGDGTHMLPVKAAPPAAARRARRSTSRSRRRPEILAHRAARRREHGDRFRSFDSGRRV